MMPPLSKFRRFDVSLAFDHGEEPLPAILKRIQSLKPGEGLLVSAPFLPSPLIEMLGGMGFSSKVEPGGAGAWLVYFWPNEQS